jgi:hypothetical protein
MEVLLMRELTFEEMATPILFGGQYVWMRQSIAKIFKYAPGTIGMILKNVHCSQLPQLGNRTDELAMDMENTFGFLDISSFDKTRMSKYKLITVIGMRHLIKHASRDKHLKDVIMPIVKHIQSIDSSILQTHDEAIVVKCDTLSKAFGVFEDAMKSSIESFKESFKNEYMADYKTLQSKLTEANRRNEDLYQRIVFIKNQSSAFTSQLELLDIAA